MSKDEVPENLELTVSRQMLEFRANIKTLADQAADSERLEARNIATGQPQQSVINLTPAVAAVLFNDYNKWNRDVSLSKMRRWRDAMDRGEWKLNHQGLAFYEDGQVADGQHRIAAVAISGTTQPFATYRGLQRAVLETIDQAFKRTAGDAMQMRGVPNGRLVARAAERIMKYEHMRRYMQTLTPSNYQIEKWAAEHDAELQSGVDISRKLREHVSSCPLSESENATIAAGLLYGGYEDVFVRTFLVAVNSGVISSDYPNAPTSALNVAFEKDARKAKTSDVLTTEEKLAKAFRGARLFFERKQVSPSAGIKWKKGTDPLPSPTPFDEDDETSEYAAD